MANNGKDEGFLSEAQHQAAIAGELECARGHFEGVIADRMRRETELVELYTRAWRDGWQAAKDGEKCVPHVPLDLLIGDSAVRT